MDYGNSESRPWSVVKTLRKEFLKLPRQAIQCKLAGVEPINGKSFHLIGTTRVNIRAETAYLFPLRAL